MPRVALLLSLSLAAGEGLATDTAAATATAPRWGEVPLETLGEEHRVREGHVAAPAEIAADAERAAGGIVVGANPALDRRLRRAARAAPDERTDEARGEGGHPYHGDEEVWIADLGVLLRDDRDGDGFFGSFELSLDVDTDGYERDVYAVIELVDGYGVPSLRHDTATFTVRGHATSDEYRIEVELLRNHPPGYRDLRVDVRDARDGRLLDEVSARSFSSLAALPLESEDEDFADDGYPAGPVPHHGAGGYGVGSVGSDDAYVAGYAAAGGPATALALAAFALLRGRRPTPPPGRARRPGRRSRLL